MEVSPMKNNRSLLSFIMGVVSIMLFLPILESLSEIICGYLELLKISSTKKVLKGNKDILDLQSSQEEIATQCMGFDMGGIEEYYDDEYDFEDKKENKIKLGFHA